MDKYGGMEVGNVGSGVPRPLSPSQPGPRRSTLLLPLLRMGCIRIGVDDIGGLVDVDAS